MRKHVYYNPSSYDGRSGHGYGTTKTKFTGQETVMGSKDTGIYVIPHTDPDDELDEEDDYIFGNVVDRILQKIQHVPTHPIGYNRQDKATYTKNQARISESRTPVRNSISPIPARNLYPAGPSKRLSGQGSGGFDGLPMFTGAANQAFRTTGPARKTGTLKGTAASPYPPDDKEDIYFFNMEDFGNIDIDELNLLKQTIKIKKVIDGLE